VFFGETSSTGGFRVSPAISAYVCVSALTSCYVPFAPFTLGEKTSLSEFTDEVVKIARKTSRPITGAANKLLRPSLQSQYHRL